MLTPGANRALAERVEVVPRALAPAAPCLDEPHHQEPCVGAVDEQDVRSADEEGVPEEALERHAVSAPMTGTPSATPFRARPEAAWRSLSPPASRMRSR